jgi:hypothetical protein
VWVEQEHSEIIPNIVHLYSLYTKSKVTKYDNLKCILFIRRYCECQFQFSGCFVLNGYKIFDYLFSENSITSHTSYMLMVSNTSNFSDFNLSNLSSFCVRPESCSVQYRKLEKNYSYLGETPPPPFPPPSPAVAL